MQRQWVPGVLLAAALAIAATTPPVAMRVEIEPLRQLGDNTEVVVVVQVAPMDRGRIGSNAIVRIELDEGRVSSGSPMRAVKAVDDGSFHITVTWPPGEHDLRVTIEDPNREDTGLWVGKVRIPGLGQATTAEETEQPESEPASETVEPPATAPQGAGGDSATEIAPTESAGEVPTAAAPAGAATVTAPAPQASKPPVEPDVAVSEALEPESAEQMTVPEPTETEPELVPESDVSEAPAIEPEASAETEPEPPPTAADREPAKPENVPRAAEEAPLVEPLRAEPPAEGVEPETVEPGGTTEEHSRPAAVSAAVAARYAEWEQADPDTREFSIIVMRRREPARGLDSGDVRLRVNGSEVPVEKLGDESNSPLLLGLAIDVLADDIDGWTGTRGSLAPIVERAAEGRGRLFVASSGAVGDWNADPESSSTTGSPLSTSNVAGLIKAALDRFEGRHGRRFLLVLTDGRNEPTKDEWQQVTDAAGEAGVPILVVALWDDEFSQRTRKNLKKLAIVSGGSLFLVQGRTQVASAADRFGRYLDGGYAVRFQEPSAAVGGSLAISVSATDREIEISAPKSIR